MFDSKRSQIDGTDLVRAYHWEGNDTFTLSGEIPLSIASLDNDRPLFLCHDPQPWRIKESESPTRLYQVEFKAPNSRWSTSIFNDYQNLLLYSESKNSYQPSETLTTFMNAGVNLFALDEKNDRGEISEFFLMHPKEYVVSIREVQLAELDLAIVIRF